MKTRLRSRRELAIVAAALLLPIPLLAASGLMVPVPSAVERGLVSLFPGGGDRYATSSISARPDQPAGEAGDGNGSEQSSAGVLSEGGNATAPAEDGAAGGDDSSAENVLPGDERLLPGGGESDSPAAPDGPGGSTDTGDDETGTGTVPGSGATSAAPDTHVSFLVSVGPQGLEVDTSGAPAGVAASAGVEAGVSEQNGITLTVGADQDDTSGDLTVTVPTSLPTIPLP
jgi:hypothetical protein